MNPADISLVIHGIGALIQYLLQLKANGQLTDDQLAAILANLPGNPMVIPPMPKKIEE